MPVQVDGRLVATDDGLSLRPYAVSSSEKGPENWFIERFKTCSSVRLEKSGREPGKAVEGEVQVAEASGSSVGGSGENAQEADGHGRYCFFPPSSSQDDAAAAVWCYGGSAVEYTLEDLPKAYAETCDDGQQR